MRVPMRVPDRRTGRDRIRLMTTGLAVSGVVGAAGITGALAIQAQAAIPPSSPARSAATPRPKTGTDDSPSPRVTQRHSTPSGVSHGSGQSQATSSGS